MSKKLTIDQFCDSIDQEFSWRKKELVDIKSSVNTIKNALLDTEIRKGILLLYAHWEGFIKQASIKYLDYISCKKFKKNELKENFACIMFRQKFKNCSSSSKMKVHLDAAKSLFLDDTVCYDATTQIKTEANLSSMVFEDILLTIGFDFSKYDTKKGLIDIDLLKARNSIAHGERRMMDKSLFNATFDGIIVIMDNFKTDIQNACCTEDYKKKEIGTIMKADSLH